MQSLAGQGEIRVSTQNIKVALPDEASKGWSGIAWLLIASFPAALGGGVLHPAINSLITKSSDKREVGGMLGISRRGFIVQPTQLLHSFMGRFSNGLAHPSRFLQVG